MNDLATHFITHDVTNQAPPLEGYDLFTSDRALTEAVVREGAAWAAPHLGESGRKLGSAEIIDAGVQANRYPPTLQTFDRFGRRQDRVEFHPAYHQMLGLAVAEGLHTAPWADPKPGAHVARAAGFFMFTQVEAGVLCPIAMTYGVVPTLQHAPAIAAEWAPKLNSRRYDPSFQPAANKTGVLMGMGMTEKQGGSDLRANTTTAQPNGDGSYSLVGHKWFFSAPMCDAFLVLAQAPKGLTCFMLPRWTPSGELNAIRIQRLKDKLGNKSNASSEVEFTGAWALPVGEEGRGIATIIEMATYTRLDCILGSSGLMRQCVAQASWHAAHRVVFQRKLADQPLMTNVLADLALETEAATVLAMRLARAFDAQDDAAETALRRVMTAAAKFWICKRGPILAAEAMEVFGGVGYVEEGPMPRLYRELPLNSIWEGSGNVMGLDTLRALARSPVSAEVVYAELSAAKGGDARLDRYVEETVAMLGKPQESDARRLCERLTLAMQAALLVRHAPAAVADAFCGSRLGGDGRVFGLLETGDFRAIVERATPQRPS